MHYLIPTLSWIIAIACLAIGLAGTVFPALPGAPLIFIGALIGAWSGDFALIGWAPLTICGVLCVLSLSVDFVATILGAKKVGASKAALVGSTIGTIIGLPFSIVGILLGPLIGAVCGELWAQRKNPDFWHIGKVGVGTWLGLLIGTVVKVVFCGMMIGCVGLALLV
jgi:uncharacterized protein YqgC (DUF456 family)